MESNGKMGFCRNAKKWIKNPFKSIKSSQTNHPEDLTTNFAQGPVSQPGAHECEVRDLTGPKDLWQAAYDQLDASQKHILSTIKLPIELNQSGASPAKEIIDEVVKTTERQFEEYQNGSLKIPGSQDFSQDYKRGTIIERCAHSICRFRSHSTCI